MPQFHFYETKQIVYEALITAESEEKAKEKFAEMDDDDKSINDSETTNLRIYKYVPVEILPNE